MIFAVFIPKATQKADWNHMRLLNNIFHEFERLQRLPFNKRLWTCASPFNRTSTFFSDFVAIFFKIQPLLSVLLHLLDFQDSGEFKVFFIMWRK
jgi:hypothetical protein